MERAVQARQSCTGAGLRMKRAGSLGTPYGIRTRDLQLERLAC